MRNDPTDENGKVAKLQIPVPANKDGIITNLQRALAKLPYSNNGGDYHIARINILGVIEAVRRM